MIAENSELKQKVLDLSIENAELKDNILDLGGEYEEDEDSRQLDLFDVSK